MYAIRSYYGWKRWIADSVWKRAEFKKALENPLASPHDLSQIAGQGLTWGALLGTFLFTFIKKRPPRPFFYEAFSLLQKALNTTFWASQPTGVSTCFVGLVITSYSIHYTKLYELSVQPLRLCGPTGMIRTLIIIFGIQQLSELESPISCFTTSHFTIL